MKVPACETLFLFERDWRQRGFRKIAGVDEAGRGPLAGPVVAACVVFEKPILIEGVYDSKCLSSNERELLYEKIISNCLAYGVGICENNFIDEVNILNATKVAMKKAVDSVLEKIDCVFIDGNVRLNLSVPSLSIVKGDRKSFTIACASIIAKVTRDRIMAKLHDEFPHYEWDKNKGYPTKKHREAIARFGITPYHRKSFRLI
ncbi:MAG: ribonuclease HII [Brevinematales bacterium]|nr:ribonuclease HII [Brevinematales bacterium]